MALIDVYNIENLSGGTGTTLLDVLKPIAATVLGFCLGLIPGWHSRVKQKNKTGELFKYELKSLEISIRGQLDALRKYIVVFKDRSKQNDALVSLDICLLHKFDLINSLDKVTLIDYYEKEYKERATNWVGETYQVLAILETDIDRLEKVYEEYQRQADLFMNRYIEAINLFRAIAIKHRDSLGREYQNDTVTKTLWNIVFSVKNTLTPTEILVFGNSIHKPLQGEIFSNVSHPLYDAILNFSLKSQMMVGEFQNKKNLYLDFLQGVELGLVEACKFLFEDEFNKE